MVEGDSGFFKTPGVVIEALPSPEKKSEAALPVVLGTALELLLVTGGWDGSKSEAAAGGAEKKSDEPEILADDPNTPLGGGAAESAAGTNAGILCADARAENASTGVDGQADALGAGSKSSPPFPAIGSGCAAENSGFAGGVNGTAAGAAGTL
jgi:hypothetical protein